MDTILEQNSEIYITKGLEKAIDYDSYVALMQELVKDKTTTGEDQSESRIQFTMLNQRRMKRWDKTVKLPESLVNEIKSFNRKVTWLVLTESWCGDAAHMLPIVNKVAALNDKIELKIVMRDEHEGLMDAFLTNGSRSIPKLIMLTGEEAKVGATYGPRPNALTKLVNEFKEEHGVLTAEFKEDIQRWYNKDKGQAILHDLLDFLSQE